MRKRNSVLVIAILVCLCFVGIAYAQMSSEITVIGSASADGSFDVEFAQKNDGKVQYTTQTSDGVKVSAKFGDDGADHDTVNITADNFSEDGDSVTITLTVVNKGTVPAVITSDDITVVVPDAAKQCFSVTSSITDGTINSNDTGEVVITVTCNEFEAMKTFSGVTVTLGYHQQTIETAPTVAHVQHN